MKKNFGYKILSEYRFILLGWYGPVQLEDLKKGMNKLTADQEFSADFNILTDISDCTLEIHPEEIPGYTKFLIHELRIGASRKAAILTSTPNEVVLSMLYSGEMREAKIDVEVFSTVQAALSHISMNNPSEDFWEKQFYKFKEAVTVG